MCVRRADPLSRGVLPNVYVSLGVIRRSKNHPHLRRGSRKCETKKEMTHLYLEVTGLGHRTKCEV